MGDESGVQSHPPTSPSPHPPILTFHHQGFWRGVLKFGVTLATTVIVAINGTNPLSLVILGVGALLAMIPNSSLLKKAFSSNQQAKKEPTITEIPDSNEFRIYRQAELKRTTASLLASSAILIAGEEGSGKSVLANAVVKKLSDDGFMVAFIEPATPKQMLLEIAGQFEIPTEDLEGKSLTAEKLKRAMPTAGYAYAQFLKQYAWC